MEQNRTKQTRSPTPGDLIEIFRPSGAYQHWAIYIGNGDVIHVTSDGSGPASSSASLGSAFGGTPTVQKQKLKIVVGDNSYRINNKYDHKYRPLPAKEIVEAAISRVGQKVHYGLLTNNCEHFVTQLRYGKSVSEQDQLFTNCFMSFQHLCIKQDEEDLKLLPDPLTQCSCGSFKAAQALEMMVFVTVAAASRSPVIAAFASRGIAGVLGQLFS